MFLIACSMTELLHAGNLSHGSGAESCLQLSGVEKIIAVSVNNFPCPGRLAPGDGHLGDGCPTYERFLKMEMPK